MEVVEKSSESKDLQESNVDLTKKVEDSNAPKKLTYEELGKIAGDLHSQVNQITMELSRVKQQNAMLMKQLDMMSVEGTYKTLEYCFKLTESNYFNSDVKKTAVQLITDILFGKEDSENK